MVWLEIWNNCKRAGSLLSASAIVGSMARVSSSARSDPFPASALKSFGNFCSESMSRGLPIEERAIAFRSSAMQPPLWIILLK